MMKLKPYPEYKDSGVDWLGDIPDHWACSPGLSVLREKKVKNLGMQESRVLSLSYGRIVVKPEEKLHGLVPESFETYQIVEPNDIIIRSTDLQNDYMSLRVGHVKDRGIITSAYICLVSRPPVTHDYCYSLLNTYDLMKIYYGLGSGLRQNLDFSDFKRLPILIPSTDEQRQIVCFLDAKTRLINRFIRNKRRLIELLQEQKQAVINACVTGKMEVRRIVDENGNPSFRFQPSSCKMRDSGIDWLGEIPEHWKISKLKYLAKLKSGENITSLDISEDGNFPVYGGNWLRGFTSSYTHDGEYILIGRQGALCGNINYAKGRFWASEHAVVVTLSSGSDLYWFGELLRIMNLNQYSESAAQPGLSVEKIQNLAVPLPSSQEQREISRNVQPVAGEIDAAISHTQRQIDLIQEYRTRLIADVVTGKVDVRGIPMEDVPEDEALEELMDELDESGEMEGSLEAEEAEDEDY